MQNVAPAMPESMSLSDVLSPYMSVFYVACISSLLLTPVALMVAKRLNCVDKPDYRKAHTEPVAYLGGVAMLVAWALAMGMATMVDVHTAAMPEGAKQLAMPWAIFAGAVLLAFVGGYDDIRRLRARYRLLAQGFAALLLAWSGIGMQVGEGALTSLSSYSGIDFSFIPEQFVTFCTLGFILLMVVGGCNSMNLIDGLDGLAGGVSALAVLGFTVISLCLAAGAYSEWGIYSPEMDPLRIVLCLSTLGVILGFLPYNFKPAVIFMGDAGSNLLGFLCVTIILLLAEKGEPALLMAGLTIFSIPIVDTGLAIVRRKMRRLPITAPDNHHLHHVLVRAGCGVRQAVLVIYGLALAFMLMGCAMLFIRLRFVAAVFLVIFAFIAIMTYKIGHRQYVTERQRREKPDASPAAAPAAPAAEGEPMVVRPVKVRWPESEPVAPASAGAPTK